MHSQNFANEYTQVQDAYFLLKIVKLDHAGLACASDWLFWAVSSAYRHLGHSCLKYGYFGASPE